MLSNSDGDRKPCQCDDCDGPAVRLELLCATIFAFLVGGFVTGLVVYLLLKGI